MIFNPRRRRDQDDLAELHEINVTPMIDVMLVLLIVFMVAAPLAMVDVPVNLPTADPAGPAAPGRPFVLTLRPDLSLAVSGETVAEADLTGRLEEGTDGDRERPVFLLADRTVQYGEVMRVMNLVRNAGYARISLVALDAR